MIYNFIFLFTNVYNKNLKLYQSLEVKMVLSKNKRGTMFMELDH